ncbi:putative glycine-rich RNA-binding protein 6, mitochondrial-like [Capsicum annuum]|nr:putative glycine-rich RNA-binding protein 6, mitochondrial-like [Capsicum annuum]
MMVVEEAVNVDGAEQELRIEKEGFRSLDGAGLGSFAKDFAPENVDDLKCVDGTGQEDLCVSKEELRTVDGAELDCCAKDCAPETCIVVRSVEMMEIEKPRNVDDSKRDRQWVVDAATELEEVCVKKQKVESLDGLELDCRATDQVKTCAPESVGGVKIEGCSTNREPETVKLEGCATNREPENVELECATNHAPETLNTEETECGEKEPKKLDNCDDQPNHGPETLNTVEMECGEKESKKLDNCVDQPNHGPETLNTEEMECGEKEPKKVNNCGDQPNNAPETLNTEEMECGGKEPKKVNNCDDQPDVRIDVKEDDMLSEVSNPNLSPRESTSSLQTASSQGVDLLSNNQGVSGDITSFSSGNSSAEESVSEEEHNQIDALKDVAKSSVVLEIPEEFSTTGVRKITFKFSKRKEDYDNASAATALPATAADDGFCEAQTWIESDDMSVHGISRTNEAFYQHRDPFSRPANMELKMSKKVTSDALPTNVKKLLSTGILEGAKVKYISTSGKILSAYEFEMHAGGKTRHPNNHIYLENGKPIYRIIQELKTAPLSQLEEVVKDVAGSSVNELYLEAWKAKLLQHDEVASAYQYSHRKVSGMYHYKPSSVMEDGLYPASYSYIDNFTPNPYSSMEIAESWKHVVKKPRCNFSSSTIESKKPAEGGTKKRDNDLHRSLFMPNGLPDGTDLAYYSKGKKVLGGYKQGNGIVCSCCDTEISPSQFESHAGCAAKRQPYRHIYTSNGLTLHDIALMLANGQSIATNNSDDMCTICGDAGELICCEGCPRAFHAACLGLQCTPTSGWLCSYCRDNFVPGRRTAGDAGPIMIRLTRVVKAPESEGGGCVVCRTPDFSVSKFDDRTVMLCDQCEKEYHVGCLRESGLCDLKELPKDKWFCCNDCHKVYVVLQNCVLKGAEVIPAPAAAVVTKKHVQNCLMDTTTNDIQWRILSGKSRFTEHLPLLSNAAVIFRECFDPIVAKSGRDLIPVMVYGRNISGQEFGGMYCVVLIVKSVVVSAGLLRIFGQEVAELPLVATSRQNQGKGYFRALFGCIEILLSSMHVKTLVLPAAEEAESIWTNKLGFRKMTDERLLAHPSRIRAVQTAKYSERVPKLKLMLSKLCRWNPRENVPKLKLMLSKLCRWNPRENSCERQN